MGRHRIVLTALPATAAAALLFIVASGYPPSLVFADGPPTQTIAMYAPPPNDCVMSTRWTENTEEHVKDALPGEWQPSWDEDALKAGASIIRQDFWYKHRHPESGWFDFCPGVTPYTFDLTTGYLQGYMSVKDPPCAPGPVRCSETNAATDATKAMGWDAWDSDGVRPNDLELPFGSCVQGETQTLAGQWGYEWRQIVRSAVYPPGVYGGYPGPGDDTYCGDIPEDQFDARVYPPLMANCLYSPFGGDSDCDGFTDERETFLETDYQGRCGEGLDSAPSSKWPADFVSGGVPNSTDRVNVFDLTSFIAPVRHFGTKPGDALYSKRWDLAVDSFPFTGIAIPDLTSFLALTPAAYPLMFGGYSGSGGNVRAFGGPVCGNHPDYGD